MIGGGGWNDDGAAYEDGGTLVGAERWKVWPLALGEVEAEVEEKVLVHVP